MNLAARWSRIWCSDCGEVRPLVIDELPANANNANAGLDLICGECHFVMATLHDAGETVLTHQFPEELRAEDLALDGFANEERELMEIAEGDIGDVDQIIHDLQHSGPAVG